MTLRLDHRRIKLFIVVPLVSVALLALRSHAILAQSSAPAEAAASLDEFPSSDNVAGSIMHFVIEEAHVRPNSVHLIRIVHWLTGYSTCFTETVQGNPCLGSGQGYFKGSFVSQNPSPARNEAGYIIKDGVLSNYYYLPSYQPDFFTVNPKWPSDYLGETYGVSLNMPKKSLCCLHSGCNVRSWYYGAGPARWWSVIWWHGEVRTDPTSGDRASAKIIIPPGKEYFPGKIQHGLYSQDTEPGNDLDVHFFENHYISYACSGLDCPANTCIADSSTGACRCSGEIDWFGWSESFLTQWGLNDSFDSEPAKIYRDTGGLPRFIAPPAAGSTEWDACLNKPLLSYCRNPCDVCPPPALQDYPESTRMGNALVSDPISGDPGVPLRWGLWSEDPAKADVWRDAAQDALTAWTEAAGEEYGDLFEYDADASSEMDPSIAVGWTNLDFFIFDTDEGWEDSIHIGGVTRLDPAFEFHLQDDIYDFCGNTVGFLVAPSVFVNGALPFSGSNVASFTIYSGGTVEWNSVPRVPVLIHEIGHTLGMDEFNVLDPSACSSGGAGSNVMCQLRFSDFPPGTHSVTMPNAPSALEGGSLECLFGRALIP